jgi:hypothetical protein
MPNFVNISVTNLQNPSTPITTDSFVLETYTYFNTKKLDMISKDLTVAFNCSSNCKTCTGAKQECTSCYGLMPLKYLDNKECKNSCPLTSYSTTINECKACSSICATCSMTASNCTSCKPGYSKSGTTCKNQSVFFSPYYYYFSAVGGIITVIVIVIKVSVKKSNFV